MNASHSARAKTPGGRADGAHATRAEGAGDAQTILRPHAVQEAVDETRVERIAAPMDRPNATA